MAELSLETVEEAAVDNCPERMDAEAAEPFRSEAGMALEAVVVLEAVVDAFQRLGSAMGVETAVLRIFFWRARKNKQEAAAGGC